MIYTIYNKESGEIIKKVTCPENEITRQYDHSKEAHIKGEASSISHYVDVKTKKIKELPQCVVAMNSLREPEMRSRMEISDEEKLVAARMRSILRNMAIEELKLEGQLPEDYE